MKMAALYDAVTEAVIRDLESGVPPWVQPWADAKLTGLGMIPSNLVTGRLYSGSNILLLWMAAKLYGYPSLQFCTFHQAHSIGAKVRKGEKAHHVIFTKRIAGDEEEGTKGSTIVKAFAVFHVSQLENVPDKYLVPQERPSLDLPEGHSEKVILARGCGVPIAHIGNRACYIPSRDEINMPLPKAFKNMDDYWGTLFHEMVHASGHKARLNREFGKRFGDTAYAREELVAELGSAYLCALTGITASFRSASYIASWLKILKADNRAILHAASYAGQAADWLWNTAHPEPMAEAAE